MCIYIRLGAAWIFNQENFSSVFFEEVLQFKQVPFLKV